MLAALRLYGSQLARQRELHGVAPVRVQGPGVQLQVSWVAIFLKFFAFRRFEPNFVFVNL
jgi:hypothetical protein